MKTIIVHWTLKKGNRSVGDFVLCDEAQLEEWRSEFYKRASADGYEANCGVHPRTIGELPSYEEMRRKFNSVITGRLSG